MNLEEIRGFCSARGIPYRIMAEYPNGKVKATKDTDRKPIVLARVRRYLTTGKSVSPPASPRRSFAQENPPRGSDLGTASTIAGTRRSSRVSCGCSANLTAGRFQDGAVARVLAMEFWTRGEAPTFEEFARSWTKAKAEEDRLLTRGVRVPDRPQASARRRRLEGIAQGQGEVGFEDAGEESRQFE